MKRGSKPKPTAIRKLEGNPGRRPFNPREPVYAPVAEAPAAPATAAAPVDVPEELQANATAAREWRRLLPLLTVARVLTEADRAALVALCQQWARYVDATAAVATTGGEIIRTTSGYPIPNPHLGIANRALNHCKQLWAEFGLTPSSRTRIATDGPGPGGDAFSEFDATDDPPAAH